MRGKCLLPSRYTTQCSQTGFKPRPLDLELNTLAIKITVPGFFTLETISHLFIFSFIRFLPEIQVASQFRGFFYTDSDFGDLKIFMSASHTCYDSKLAFIKTLYSLRVPIGTQCVMSRLFKYLRDFYEFFLP